MSGYNKGNTTPKIDGYNILEKIGFGSYSIVYKAINKSGVKDYVAIKCVDQGKLKGSAADNIITEIRLLKELKHNYIVEMKDFSWDSKCIYIILEFCDGGDLSCFIRKRKKLSESTCKTFLQQLAQAMKYLREHNVCHMDLKPQNLLLSTKPQLTLKLGDFGFSQYMKPEGKSSSLRGSLLYMAPEMLLYDDYDASVDLWSIGVIMYECLFGKAPYSSNTVMELTEKIKMQKPIDIPQNSGLSSECRDLLIRLLQHDPKLRISFDNFFSHSFLDLEHIPTPESYNKGLQIVCDAIKFDKEKKYTDAFNLYCEALRYFVPLILAESDLKKKNALRLKVNEYISRAETLKQFVDPCQSADGQGSRKVCKAFGHITSGSVFRELRITSSARALDKLIWRSCGIVRTGAILLSCSETSILGNEFQLQYLGHVAGDGEVISVHGVKEFRVPQFEKHKDLLCAEEPAICEVLEMGCNAEQHYAESQYRLAFDKFQNCIRILLPVLSREPPGRRRDLLLNQVEHWMKEAESTKALLSALDLNGANSVIEKGDSCRLQ